nr:hypothetical protein CFP56_72859 [Quercus suber]
MAATPTLFSLLVHHGPRTSIIHNVDPNWYSYVDMSQDVLETILVDLPANIDANINIKCEIPNSMDIMNVNNDTNMLNMFDTYEDEGCHPNFSDNFGHDLLAGVAMNFSHDINATKGKEVTDEMLLALASVPEDFNILAPMGVEFDYFEE